MLAPEAGVAAGALKALQRRPLGIEGGAAALVQGRWPKLRRQLEVAHVHGFARRGDDGVDGAPTACVLQSEGDDVFLSGHEPDRLEPPGAVGLRAASECRGKRGIWILAYGHL